MLDEINPAPRLLMGPGPINADPRVLRAMSAQLLGQFDPQFREYMKEVSELYRGVFQTKNRWTLAHRRHRALGDRGGARLADRARRSSAGSGLRPLRTSQGGDRQALRRRSRPHRSRMGHGVHSGSTRDRDQEAPPKIVAVSHGDTSTTMAQPLPSSAPRAARTTSCSMSMPPPRSAAWIFRPMPGSSTW